MFGIDDALIGAGVSLIGGLFGGDDETTTSQINYKDMVKDAEEAGFNPLTVLRNGGSAGYVQTSHPALSSGAFIADALGKVGNLISNYDPMAKATADLEYKIKQETLRNLQADTAQRLKYTASIGGVPATSGSTVVRSPGGMVHAKPKPMEDLYTPYRDNSEIGGGKTVWLPNPNIADIEQVPVAAGATGLRGPQEAYKEIVEKPWVKVTKVPDRPNGAGYGSGGWSRYIPSFAIKWH